MEFKYFVIIDPDQISCYITSHTIKAAISEAEVIIFEQYSLALSYLSSQDEPCCIVVENTVLNLPAKSLLVILKDLAEKNFRVIILSNAFQKKLLSVIPRLYHVRFTYKPLTKKKFQEILKEW